MSDLTTAQSAIVARVRKAATVTDRNAVTIADGLVALKVSGLSGRAIARHLAGTDYPLGVNRVAVIIRTREAHPGEDYVQALRDATAANSASKAPEVTTEQATEQVSPQGTAATVTTEDAPDVAPVTLDGLTDALAALFEQARALTTEDLSRFLAAVDAEVSFSAPVTVALPVAA